MQFRDLFRDPEVGLRLAEHMLDWFLVFDRNGTLLDANRKASGTLGYSHDELLSLSLWDITRGFSAAEFSTLFGPTPEVPLILTGFSRHKNAGMHPVQVHAWAHRSGEVEMILAVIRDITESELAKRALEDSEARFRKIFEHSNDAILVVDPENDAILDANPQACSMLGYTYGELRSIPISAIHPHEMPEFLSFAHSVLEAGTGWTRELRCRTKSGVVLPAEISASLLEIDERPVLLALVRSPGEGDVEEGRLQGRPQEQTP